jgi:hypothetical protein
VAERVATAVLLQEGAQTGLVVLRQACGRVFGAEGQVDRGDGGQQTERAEGESHRPGRVALVVDRTLEAEQAVQNVADAVRDARIADQAVRVDADDDQAENE